MVPNAIAGLNRASASNISTPWMGWLAMAATVLLWAGFAISIRAIGVSGLTVADVALIRFGLPALVLLPWLPARLGALRRMRPRHVLMVLIGGGLPFFFIASAGGRSTSAAHVSALIAGTTPVGVALVGLALFRTRVEKKRWVAIGLILAGVVALLIPERAGAQVSTAGCLLLLGASVLWAVYTLGLRHAGLDAIGSTLLLTLPSAGLVVALMVAGVLDSHLAQATMAQVLPSVVLQGVGVGVLASLCYVTAIRRLGAPTSAAAGSATPGIAAVIAVFVLNEPLTPMVTFGVLLIACGVYYASRLQAK